MKHIKLLSLLAIALTIVGIFGVEQLHAAPATHPPKKTSNVVRHTLAQKDQQKAQYYWTAAKMKAAISVDTFASPAKGSHTATVIPPHGPAVSHPATTPRKAKTAGITPSSQYASAQSVIGKVFFTTASGGNASCSGTAATSNNGSVVDTAAHCIYESDGWAKNWVFCPAYQDGNCPYGMWSAQEYAISGQWANGDINEASYDYGDVSMYPNNSGRLMDVVGGAGWLYNASNTMQTHAMGYPGYTGNLQECPLVTMYPSPQFGNSVTIPCDLKAGSSGGPWFSLANDGYYYLNGHNDFADGYSIVISPYYGDEWFSIFDAAQNCC